MSQYSNTGELLSQSRIIEKDLKQLLTPLIQDSVLPLNNTGIAMLFEVIGKDLSRYVLEQRGEDFFRGEKVGRAYGLKEAMAIMETVIGSDRKPQDYDGTVDVAVRNEWVHRVNNVLHEQRKRLNKAIVAISKSTEEKG